MTTIQLTTIRDLTSAQWSAWQEIQQGTTVYESPYFRPEFAQAVAAVRSDVEVAVLSQAERIVGFFPFQRGKLNLGKPLGGKLSDYHGPLLRSGISVDPPALLAACRLVSWDFDHLVAIPSFAPFVTARELSPQLDLTEGFEVHARHRREAGSDTIHRQGQKTRKLGREVGRLDFQYDAEDDEAFDLLRAWKSAQYLRTGLTDVFTFPWTTELLARLRHHREKDFAAPLTVLRAGDKVAAVTLSLVSHGVLHSWFTAFNPELSSYSPGLSLFIHLAEEGPALGIRKIDLGKGQERYKWSLASQSIEVTEGAVTSPSLATWLRGSWRGAKRWVQNSRLQGATRLPARLIKPLRDWMAYQ